MRYDQPELRDRLAATYALGALRGPARRRLEQLMLTDAALTDAVEYWQMRLNGLAEAMPPLVPPPYIWSAIEQTIGAGPTIIPFPAPKTRNSGRSIALWRGFGLVAGAIAAVLAIYIGVKRPDTLSQNPTVAVLNDDGGHAAFVATAGHNARRLAIAVVADSTPPAGHVYELWLLPKGGAKPRPLGLLPPLRQASFTLSPDDARAFTMADGIAISLEPDGGSPTGLPTGPVLFKGSVITQP